MEGKLVGMISMRVPVFIDLGLYLLGLLIICVRLRASSSDCRMAGVLACHSLGHLAARALKIDGGNSVHIWCPGHSWGLFGYITG